MNINEVSKRVGITRENIRFYEREGLVVPDRDSENNYRNYSEADVARLRKIRLLRSLYIPVADIRRIIDGELLLTDAADIRLNDLKARIEEYDAVGSVCKNIINREVTFEELDDDVLSDTGKAPVEMSERVLGMDHLKEIINELKAAGITPHRAAYCYTRDTRHAVWGILFELANEGYVQLEEGERDLDILIRKVRNYDGTEPETKVFFDGIFARGDETSSRKLKNILPHVIHDTDDAISKVRKQYDFATPENKQLVADLEKAIRKESGKLHTGFNDNRLFYDIFVYAYIFRNAVYAFCESFSYSVGKGPEWFTIHYDDFTVTLFVEYIDRSMSLVGYTGSSRTSPLQGVFMDPVGENNSDVRSGLFLRSALVILFVICLVVAETKYSSIAESSIMLVIFIAVDIIIGIFIAIRMSSWWRMKK